jgi:two-component system sensor histidine kinase GlrK
VGQLSPRQSEIIGIIQKNCSKLQSQIESLLRYNSESLSMLKPMPHRVRFDDVIRRVISDHTLTIKGGKIQVNCNLDKITVIGDKEQLRLIIDNLFTNAIKYSPENGKIDFILQTEEQYARLDVCDEGPGIPDHDHEKIFDAFYQGDPPAGKQIVKGTGLGLAIVREYLKLNNGSIESIQVLQGAHFIVRIPLANGGEDVNTHPV